MKFKKGDKVVVVNPEFTFGDYDVGSKATVTAEFGDILFVDWDEFYFNNHERDADRVRVLYVREVKKS